MTATPRTSVEAYRDIKANAEDETLRRRVAAALAMRAMTTQELAAEFPDRSQNAIRPRINELLRMGCVEREGTRETAAGNEAYVNHLTDTGEAWLRGEADPEMAPPLAALERTVVDAARDYCDGAIDEHILAAVVERHDRAKRRRTPGWSPDE